MTETNNPTVTILTDGNSIELEIINPDYLDLGQVRKDDLALLFGNHYYNTLVDWEEYRKQGKRIEKYRRQRRERRKSK